MARGTRQLEMRADFTDLLAGVPALAALDHSSLRELSSAFEPRRFPDRSVVLHQGTVSAGLYLLHRGSVAVRVQRAGQRETVAEITPPGFFGELSFVTGRPCVADVEAVGPIEVGVLTKEALEGLGPARDVLLNALLHLVSVRLHDTVSGARVLNRARIVWLRADAAFPAARAFAVELARALHAGAIGDTLVVADGLGGSEVPRTAGDAPFAIAALPRTGEAIAAGLEGWRRDFRHTVVLASREPRGIEPAASGVDVVGDLIAGAAPLPPVDGVRSFVAADAARTRLDRLAGARQLVFDTDAAEAALQSGDVTPPRFRRTAHSLARFVLGRQVGLALGGGGACCWAHLGMLSVLEEAGIPVDMVAGCSMGSLVGGLFSAGRTVTEITAIADWWRTRYWRMIEPRFWRLHLVSARGLEKALVGYFGDRLLPSLEVPFWANAVDIESGEEVILDRVPVARAVRASMALPGSWPPLDLDGRVLVDAAIMAPVPVGPVRAMGADFVVAMNVMPPMRAGAVRRRNPMRFYDVLQRSLRIGGHEIGRNRAVGDADIMLMPALESHSMADFPRCHEIIRAGAEETGRHRSQIVAAYRALTEARS